MALNTACCVGIRKSIPRAENHMFAAAYDVLHCSAIAATCHALIHIVEVREQEKGQDVNEKFFHLSLTSYTPKT